MCPEALQLRMVPIAFCLPTQYSPRQECFPPQRNQPPRIKVLRMDGPESHVTQWCLTMRLSDAGLRRRPTKLIYPNHRSTPWLILATTCDRSNRLLGAIRVQGRMVRVSVLPLNFTFGQTLADCSKIGLPRNNYT
jgi:hypothetical protein